MSRLIDTEEFIKRIDHYPPGIRDTAKKELRYCKTVDAVHVRHGHWIQDGEPPMFSLTCSVCGQKFFNHYLQPHANYCSMCGTKMDEVTE